MAKRMSAMHCWAGLMLVVWLAVAAMGSWSDGPSTAPPTDEQVAKLIDQLGDPEYFVRQQAQEALLRIGFEAFDALTRATTHDDLEVAARARYVLRRMQVEWSRESDPPPVKTLLEKYGWLKAEERHDRIEKLAQLPEGVGVEALCRIVRFEQSSAMSKLAATELLRVYATGESALVEPVVSTILESLGSSRRSGARWLLTWANHHRNGDDWESLAAHFAEFADEEQASMSRPDFAANTDALAALLRLQVAWLEEADCREQAVGVMRKLIALERGDVDNLKKLLQWLIAQKAWPLVDDLAARFPGPLQSTPALLYLLAEAQAEQGNAAVAERTAEQALSLRPGNNPTWLEERHRMAIELWQRLRPEWAVREFRYVLDHGAKADLITLGARHSFARLLHDRGEALEAAEVLQTFVERIESTPDLATPWGGNVGLTRARMHYYFACHYGELNDRAKQREHLDKALADDPDELDALIARYHLPEQTEAYRRETLDLIHASAEMLRESIANQPDEATWYNQFAWLIGNTEGDLDEALQFSHKSLELSPNEGAYYDTLAHVYFAKKDYSNAVKYQAKAAELESYSKLIRDKLAVFRAAMESR